jgi:hypothetical protein
MKTRDEAEKDRIARIEAENEAAIQAWRAKREASRSIEYSTNDEHARLDEAFDAAHDAVTRCIVSNAEITDEVEEAADAMFDISVQLGDRLMLAFCFARYDDFVRARRAPPWAMLEHIGDALTRYRSHGGTTLDAAFGLAKSGKGRPPSWLERLQNRTASDFIAHLVMEKGLSENKAIAQAEDFFKRGDLRDVWLKFRRIVKGE